MLPGNQDSNSRANIRPMPRKCPMKDKMSVISLSFMKPQIFNFHAAKCRGGLAKKSPPNLSKFEAILSCAPENCDTSVLGRVSVVLRSPIDRLLTNESSLTVRPFPCAAELNVKPKAHGPGHRRRYNPNILKQGRCMDTHFSGALAGR